MDNSRSAVPFSAMVPRFLLVFFFSFSNAPGIMLSEKKKTPGCFVSLGSYFLVFLWKHLALV
jgi:hypothetical protein